MNFVSGVLSALINNDWKKDAQLTVEQFSSIEFIPFSPGDLSIIGVEYTLKGIFPEKDPTDHEIRGKQMFQVNIQTFNKSEVLGNLNIFLVQLFINNMKKIKC